MNKLTILGVLTCFVCSMSVMGESRKDISELQKRKAIKDSKVPAHLNNSDNDSNSNGAIVNSGQISIPDTGIVDEKGPTDGPHEIESDVIVD